MIKLILLLFLIPKLLIGQVDSTVNKKVEYQLDAKNLANNKHRLFGEGRLVIVEYRTNQSVHKLKGIITHISKDLIRVAHKQGFQTISVRLKIKDIIKLTASNGEFLDLMGTVMQFGGGIVAGAGLYSGIIGIVFGEYSMLLITPIGITVMIIGARLRGRKMRYSRGWRFNSKEI